MDHLKETFKKYDQDDSGHITYEEYAEILKDEMNIPVSKIKQLIKQFDRDGDGKLSFEEFLHHYNQVQKNQLDSDKPAVLGGIDDVMFDILAGNNHLVTVGKFFDLITDTGVRLDDPRLAECMKNFEKEREKHGGKSDGEDKWNFNVDKETFKRCIFPNVGLVGKIFKAELIVPEFKEFRKLTKTIFKNCKANTGGLPAQYIPQLAGRNPKYWGVSICTIDGQRVSYGDTKEEFCIQSCCKALNYALAISDIGADKVHHHVGQEPSGQSFNELTLDKNNKPHNPMINAGAIVTVSLLRPELTQEERLEFCKQQYKRLAGGEFIGYSEATYLSERDTADRNFALGYYMRENSCFPKGTDLIQTLELYFQLCSVELTAESGSVIAATLANGGICPITGERVLAADAVRNVLSLMYSCGMYDHSGQFAFNVGLPAKSGVAGAVLLVIPNVMGVCTWSPPLDELGNSVRGLQFCEELIDVFNFHNYDNLLNAEKKIDPRNQRGNKGTNSTVKLLYSAANGDVVFIKRAIVSSDTYDMAATDYGGRTALHIAAAEGHLPVVAVLLFHSHVSHSPKDKRGFTPLDDAEWFKHDKVADFLRKYIEIHEKSGDVKPSDMKEFDIPTDLPPATFRAANRDPIQKDSKSKRDSGSKFNIFKKSK